jgi:maleate cis-trans isomerase
MFMCTVRQITYSCPVEFPFIVPIEARPNKQKLLAQISYPNQFATAIVTSTGALIAALKAREVEKVSQRCPFNRIGK